MEWEDWSRDEKKKIKEKLTAKMGEGKYAATAIITEDEFGILGNKVEVIDEKTGEKYVKEIKTAMIHIYEVHRGPSGDVYNLVIEVEYREESQPKSKITAIAEVKKNKGVIKGVNIINHTSKTHEKYSTDTSIHVPRALLDKLENAVYGIIEPKVITAVKEYSKIGKKVLE